jgi:predicted RNA-binding protein
MCQATVYLNDEEFMQDVINIQPMPEGLRLATFFEAPKIVRATVCEIDFLKHRVWLEAIAEPGPEGDES